MAFKMKGSELYGNLKLNRNMDSTSKKDGRAGSSGLQKSSPAKQTDEMAGTDLDAKAKRDMSRERTANETAMDRAVNRLGMARFPEGVNTEEQKEAYMSSREGRTASDEAAKRAEEAKGKGEDYWSKQEEVSAQSKVSTAEKTAARKAEGDARRAATAARNEAGYGGMNKRQQKRFREANPQYFS
tara:strand:- start:283 stop:837 length:555 start_codon:yes stop_codon:yes gene_type:complete